MEILIFLKFYFFGFQIIHSIKYNGNADFAEISIHSQILVTKLKINQYFSILKMFKFHSIKDNGNVNFAENCFYSLILVTKL